MCEENRYRWLLLATIWALAGCDRTVVKGEPADSQVESSTPTGLVKQPGNQELKQQSNGEPSSLVDQNSVDQAGSEGDSTGTQSTLERPTVEKRYVAIPPTKSDDPIKMLEHLAEIDRAIQDLLLTSRQMEAQASHQAAVQLSQMKLEAAQHLSQLSTASPEQSLAGVQAQLVALSHLSGLKDVQAARRLEELARELSKHPNAELRHQSQVVLFGFEIQNLQNGILKDANQLVALAREMLMEPRFRTRLEMTSITHALNVLYQMGFTEEAKEMEKTSFQAYSDSYDRELRYEAWNQLTRRSPIVENFLTSLQSTKNGASEGTPVLVAARGVIQEHPNSVTLEMIAGVIPDVEYGGQLQLSTELTRLVDSELAKYAQGISTAAIEATLAEHRQRMGWLDRKLELPALTDADGKSLELSELEGKVVLIDFWATWCLPCLQELPNLRNVYEALSAKGFTIVSINMDKDADRLKQFLEDQRLPWPTYRPADGDTKALTDQFGITLFPHTMLMNRQGKVVDLHVRGPEVQKRAEQLLQAEL